MSSLAIKLSAFLFLLGSLLLLGRWALQVSEKPRELTPQVESAIGPASDILLGQDQLMAITLKSASSAFTFALRPNGWWWMLEPERNMAKQSLAQMWIGALTRPKLMRVLEAKEWTLQNPSLAIEVNLKGQRSQTQLRYMFFESQPQFYYLQLSNGVVLKAEQQVDLTWSNKVEDWRSRRLWPFELDAVQKMIYRQAKSERVWLKNDKGWTSTGNSLEDVWKTYFKNWDNLGCTSFLEPPPKNLPVLASWEFFFDSGSKSLLELFRSELGEWFVVYRSRELGMVLNEDTLRQAFPEGPWAK